MKDETLHECGAQYERDSVLHIRDWAGQNVFENVKEEENFDIYTVFVTAYEIIIDTSPPPVNLSRHERVAWRPKHVVRIVLSFIAIALQIPILQLKPSVLNYTCIAANTTFKLSICKLLKVSLLIYVCAYISEYLIQ